MAKDSQRLEQEFIAAARDKTGHDVPEWMAIIAGANLPAKPNTIIAWLKDQHKLNHMQAGFLAGIYLNDGQPVFDYAVLFEKLFTGKEVLLPLYRTLENAITGMLPDVVLIPTRAYMSVEGKRIFACITPTKTLLRVGLDLGERPFDDVVQKAKSLGAMPNLTHMVELQSAADAGAPLLALVQEAYDRTHAK